MASISFREVESCRAEPIQDVKVTLLPGERESYPRTQAVQRRPREPAVSTCGSVLQSGPHANADLRVHSNELTLESWKQIAAYLNRSERTVRRWESCEGLPVHRHGHQKQDAVFARVDEVDRWMSRRTQRVRPAASATSSEPQDAASEAVRNRPSAANGYLAEHDAIT